MSGKKRKQDTGTVLRRRLGLLVFALAALIFSFLSAPLAESAEDPPIEPLASEWQQVMITKHRAIISFMDTDYGLKTFRGQAENLETDLSNYYGANVITTTKADLGVLGTSDSRVFSQSQAFGLVPQTRTIPDDFMGTKTFTKVPTGVICTSYLTRTDADANNTYLWMELTGRNETTGTVERIGRVKLTGIYRPYYHYKFNADGSKIFAAPLDQNVAHDMAAWDWNGDGYTDWLVNCLTNPVGIDSHKNMKVSLVFVDGKSLYDACRGLGSVRVWQNTEWEYTTGGIVVGGLTGWEPPNSVRTAIGDMDGDGIPEVALYYTKVQGGSDHNNHLKILNLRYNGSSDPSWEWIFQKGDDAGRWNTRYDSVTVAMGDLDGDGFDELAVLHGRTPSIGKNSTLYLDVYKIVNGTVEKLVKGEEIGTTAKCSDHSAPAVEASIDDLDGDGIDELVHIHSQGDTISRLHINVHKWPVVEGAVPLTGQGTRYGYYLTAQDSTWTLHSDYARFSISTGMFAYPETEILKKQIGLVSTLPGSSGKEGLRWGIFSWNETDGLLLIAKGTKADGALKSNVVPTITAADIDGDSMVLGEPTGFTVYDNIEPVFIIQAPPRHWDVLSEGGTTRIMDSFAVLNGYSTTMMGKASDSETTLTTKTSEGHWGASLGLSVSRVFRQKDNTTLFEAGLEYAGESAHAHTEGTTVTTTASLSATAQYDDQVYFRANTHDVWRYPVLMPESQAFVTEDSVTYRKFVQFIVPRVIQSSFSPTAGKEVDWYDPWHNGLNLFSYPRTLEQTRDYPQGAASKLDDDFWKDINGLVLAKSTGQIMGNVDSTQSNFTMEVIDHEDDLDSLKNTWGGYSKINYPSYGKLIKVTAHVGLHGDYCLGTDTTTTSDKSKLGGITVSWPGVAGYASPSGMTPSDQQFTVDAAIYASDTGTISFAYAVSRLAKLYSQIWGPGSPYKATADPALNLPRQWVINAGKWQENPFPGDAGRMRGLHFEGATIVASGGVSGQVMPINSEVTASLRVYNYSFVPTGNVTVTLSFQPITSSTDLPDISKATPLGSRTIPSIPGRDSGTTNNWTDLTKVFTTRSTQAVGYLHVSLATDGGNLQTNNDQGHILVGVYDPANFVSSTQTAAAASEGGGRLLKSAAAGGRLNIVADSMSIRPLNEDGSFGEETTYLDSGRTAAVQGTIRFDHAQGIKDSTLLHVSVFLRDEKGFVSHRIVPLLKNGTEHVVRMLYTAPDINRSFPLQMIVTSDILPAADDENPEGRTVTKILTVGEPNDSGCSAAGFAPAALLLFLPVLFLRSR